MQQKENAILEGSMNAVPNRIFPYLRKRFPAACLVFVVSSGFASPMQGVELKSYLTTRGISEKSFERLKEKRLVSGNSFEEIASCSKEDNLPFNEKFLMADAVIEGRITDITYLYKEGGRYRTVYTIETTGALRGGVQGTVKVFSPFGPNSKDHRRWIRHPSRIEYQIGDEGLFLLDAATVKGLRQKFPGREILNSVDYTFVGSAVKGVYLYDKGGLDIDGKFHVASGKGEKGLSVPALRSSSKAIMEILETEKE